MFEIIYYSVDDKLEACPSLFLSLLNFAVSKTIQSNVCNSCSNNEVVCHSIRGRSFTLLSVALFSIVLLIIKVSLLICLHMMNMLSLVVPLLKEKVSILDPCFDMHINKIHRTPPYLHIGVDGQTVHQFIALALQKVLLGPRVRLEE